MPVLARLLARPLGRLLPLGLALPVLLAACSSNEGPKPCPEALGIQDASRLTKFNSAGRDLTDVLFEAEIKQLQLVCEYDDDVVVASMRIVFQALRGAANTQGVAPVRYFVAIADREQQILAREEFDLEIPFQGNWMRVAMSEELSQRIPLKSDDSAAGYKIYVGFALTEEEMRYNRSRR